MFSSKCITRTSKFNEALPKIITDPQPVTRNLNNMNRAQVILFSVVSLAIIAVSYADYEDPTTILLDDNTFADVVNKTLFLDDVEDVFLMLPSSEKAVMMLNSGKPNANCYVCSSPCSRIYCCNDGYPQCCLVNGYCGCCRF